MYRSISVRNTAIAGILALVLLIAVPVAADDSEDIYDSSFLGISYHYQSFLDTDEDTFIDGLSPRGAGGTFTYGFPGFRFARVRAGVGWEPEQPLYTALGVEVPLFERFNRANARAVGLFVLSDLVFGFPNEPRISVDTKLVGMLPISMIGGISFGGGVTHRGEPILHIGYKTGVFPRD